MVPRFSFKFIYKDLLYFINMIGIYPKILYIKINKLKAIEKEPITQIHKDVIYKAKFLLNNQQKD